MARKLVPGNCIPSIHKQEPPPHLDKAAGPHGPPEPPHPPFQGGKKPAISANLRPPLLGDISKLSHHGGEPNPHSVSNFVTDVPPIKHDLVIHSNHPHQDFHHEIDLSVPKPLLLPIEPQTTLFNFPGKPTALPQNKFDHGITNSIKKLNQGLVWTKKQPSPGPPLQPYHLSGPPGAWNIVTSAPGSLPPPIHVYQSKFPTGRPAGVDLQYGAKLPPPLLPPPAHFPARRRPSTGALWPRHPGDLLYAGSDTTVSVATQPPTTESLMGPTTMEPWNHHGTM